MNKRKIIIAAAILLATMVAVPAASSAPDSGSDFADIVKKVYPCVVRVEVRNHVIRVATGVVVDNKGHIVTTALISPRDEKVYVITSDGNKEEAKFLGLDSETHLAVIKIDEGKLKPIPMGKSEDLDPGERIGIVGISPENNAAVTEGIVSSKGDDRIRLNVWVVQGMSGSPVVNQKGRLVGILRGAYSASQPVVVEFRDKSISGSGYVFSRAETPTSAMAVAHPVDVIVKISDEIIKKGKVERGWLGVDVFEDEDARVIIAYVEKKSPADKADLRPGDIVLEFNGKQIPGSKELAKKIRNHKPGETIELKIERKEKEQKIKIELGEFSRKYIIREFESKFPRLFPPQPPQTPGKPEVP